MAGYGKQLALDRSAYTRVLLARQKGAGGGRLKAAGLRRFEDAVIGDELWVCPPFRLEARYSATSAHDFAALDAELDGFKQTGSDGRTWQLALTAQQALANDKAVSHRVKFADLLVAAAAHQVGVGVLHYDKDYDTIAHHTNLMIESQWIAPKARWTERQCRRRDSKQRVLSRLV